MTQDLSDVKQVVEADCENANLFLAAGWQLIRPPENNTYCLGWRKNGNPVFPVTKRPPRNVGTTFYNALKVAGVPVSLLSTVLFYSNSVAPRVLPDRDAITDYINSGLKQSGDHIANIVEVLGREAYDVATGNLPFSPNHGPFQQWPTMPNSPPPPPPMPPTYYAGAQGATGPQDGGSSLGWDDTEEQSDGTIG